MGSFLIFRHVASSLKSMVVIAAIDSVIKQCVCMILELAPYKRRRCFIPGGRGVDRIVLLMIDKVAIVHLMSLVTRLATTKRLDPKLSTP